MLSSVLSLLYWGYCSGSTVLGLLYWVYCSGSTVLGLLFWVYCTGSTVLGLLYCEHPILVMLHAIVQADICSAGFMQLSSHAAFENTNASIEDIVVDSNDDDNASI